MKKVFFCVGFSVIACNGGFCMDKAIPKHVIIMPSSSTITKVIGMLPKVILDQEKEIRGVVRDGRSLVSEIINSNSSDCYNGLQDLMIAYDKETITYDGEMSLSLADGVAAKVALFLLEHFKKSSPQLEVYKIAYRFCAAWKITDLSDFPSLQRPGY